MVSAGDLSSAIIHPREVLKAAVLANASSFILFHNHPSGDPSPSREDFLVTDRIWKAAEIVGIPLVDHVVLGSEGRFVSLREQKPASFLSGGKTERCAGGD
jgi:DNA repair protein RadC